MDRSDTKKYIRRDLSPWSREPVPPPHFGRTRPKTLAEAKLLVAEIYENNRWDRATQLRYEGVNCGLEVRSSLSEYSADEIRKIVDRMVWGRMIAFKDNTGE